MRLIFTLIICFIFHSSYSQEKVYFKASDGLRITADLYLKDKKLPFILLFHQVGSSRGEYNQIAQKLLHLDYNCLAVDLRSGGEMNYVQNETAAFALQNNFKHSMYDSRLDIEAAIRYVSTYNTKGVILMGSSFSASLCMIEGKSNDRVGAIIALSPGEFFTTEISVRDELRNFNKFIFVSATSKESGYVLKLLDYVPSDRKSVFSAKDGNESYGSAILSNDTKDGRECWMQLSLFFKKIKPGEFGAANISH